MVEKGSKAGLPSSLLFLKPHTEFSSPKVFSLVLNYSC